MGLLDDAIRDHLELKRRHGADETELARAEQEALGPVRREPLDVAEPASRGRSGAARAATRDQIEEGTAAYERHDEPPGDHPVAEPSMGEYEEYDDEDYYIEEEGPPEWEPTPSAERASRERDREESPTTIYTPEREAVDDSEPGESRRRPRRRSAGKEHRGAPAQSGLTDVPPEAGDGEETIEYELDETLPAGEQEHRGSSKDAGPAGVEDGGDVLEETPEFLQDAPEHDRLWFEQRPPRDFDFDD